MSTKLFVDFSFLKVRLFFNILNNIIGRTASLIYFLKWF